MKGYSKLKRVLVDSMVIIEAHRTRCWRALVGRYRMETVAECVVECGTGDHHRKGYVFIDTNQLQKDIYVVKPKADDIFKLDLRLGGDFDIHKGERHLLAYALSIKEETWEICAPENALLRAAFELDLLDRFISLEYLIKGAGLKPKLKENYTTKWLTSHKTRIKLERI